MSDANKERSWDIVTEVTHDGYILKYDGYFILENEGHIRRLKRFIRKDGKLGKSWIDIAWDYFTPLKICDKCGKLSTPKKIQTRWLGVPWDKYTMSHGTHITENFYGDLCMSCYNKMRPIYDNYTNIYESRKLLNKLKRTIYHVNKNQNHRTTKRVSC